MDPRFTAQLERAVDTNQTTVVGAINDHSHYEFDINCMMQRRYWVGTHRKGQRVYAGAWVVPSLADALERTNPKRYMTDDGQHYSRRSCPVVLEVRAAHLARMGGHSTMHCSRWAQTQRHAGFLIQKVHFNIRLMLNYLLLEDPDLRSEMLLHPHTVVVCGCGVCGAVTPPCSPYVWQWEKAEGPRPGSLVSSGGASGYHLQVESSASPTHQHRACPLREKENIIIIIAKVGAEVGSPRD